MSDDDRVEYAVRRADALGQVLKVGLRGADDVDGDIRRQDAQEVAIRSFDQSGGVVRVVDHQFPDGALAVGEQDAIRGGRGAACALGTAEPDEPRGQNQAYDDAEKDRAMVHGETPERYCLLRAHILAFRDGHERRLLL